MKRGITVSDHAVLRYLERVGGFDVECLRREIAARVGKTALTGSHNVVIDGHRFVIKRGIDGPVVVTVLKHAWDLATHQIEASE